MDFLEDFSDHRYLIGILTFAGIGFFVLRGYFSGGVCTNNKRIDGQTIIITGANIGIGLETAKELARRGGRIILACRDSSRGHTAVSEVKKFSGNNQVVFQHLDLASLASVRDFCFRINQTEDRLDILINNAGIMACPQATTAEGYELQFGTNHLGHFLLTNLLLDLLKKSAPSRVINLSSIAHKSGRINFKNINMKGEYNSFGAYCQSKLANIIFTKELAKRLKNTGVVTMAVHPGVVNTNLLQHFAGILRFLFSRAPFIKTAVEGAQTTLHCALLDPPPSMKAGELFYFSDCDVKDPAPHARSDEDAKQLWDLSAEMVGLSCNSSETS